MNDVVQNADDRSGAVKAAGVSITDLRKSYGSNEVLKGISLEVKPGEVVCLIGPSGSGKSTLLRCVNLLEQPNEGSVHVGGFEATDPDVDIDKMRRKVGMVFQQFNLFPHLSALRQLHHRADQGAQAQPGGRLGRGDAESGAGGPGTPCRPLP